MSKKFLQTLNIFAKSQKSWSNAEMALISKSSAKKLTMGTSKKRVESQGSTKYYA